ncbi:MAG: Short-chain dehydrogenase/reductase [Edaphobacter sp.]|nr:Short-chain dehydrogenase/reductase [Edaphobacter sp.]
MVLCARRTERLESLTRDSRNGGGTAHFRVLDVTRLEDMQAFVDFTLTTHGHIDVIVNNAGVMPLSKLEEIKVEEWNRMVDVNIRGVLHGIAAGLPVMKKQNRGQFINLSSIGGHTVYPTSAVYSATKFAVIAISEGLRQENDNIRVTVISPGVTESEFAESISDEGARDAMKTFRQIVQPMRSPDRSICPTMWSMKSSCVPRQRALMLVWPRW